MALNFRRKKAAVCMYSDLKNRFESPFDACFTTSSISLAAPGKTSCISYYSLTAGVNSMVLFFRIMTSRPWGQWYYKIDDASRLRIYAHIVLTCSSAVEVDPFWIYPCLDLILAVSKVQSGGSLPVSPALPHRYLIHNAINPTHHCTALNWTLKFFHFPCVPCGEMLVSKHLPQGRNTCAWFTWTIWRARVVITIRRHRLNVFGWRTLLAAIKQIDISVWHHEHSMLSLKREAVVIRILQRPGCHWANCGESVGYCI